MLWWGCASQTLGYGAGDGMRMKKQVGGPSRPIIALLSNFAHLNKK